MSNTPLTTRALERIRGIAAGNGIDASTIKVTRTDEAEYQLTGELSFSARWELELAKPEELRNFPAKDVPSTETLHSMASARPFPGQWWAAVLDELKANNIGGGTGWGADGTTVSLPAFTELYNVREVCRTCAGDKIIDCSTCDGSGLEWCWHCNRSGREPANPQQPCTVCKGEMKAECRTCNGRRKVGCPACKGRGSKQTVYALRFTASTRFALKGNAELPSALRRSIDRAGAAKLANGHATIAEVPQPEGVEMNPLAPRVEFRATLPFASVSFDIAGRAFTAELLGNRTAILEMKPFLDQIAANALGDAKLHELRLFAEAQAIAARQGGAADFIRGYPVGLSREMADKIFTIARASLNDILEKPRRLALLAGIGAALLLSALYFYGPLRVWMHMIPASGERFWDLAFPLIPAVAFMVGVKMWTTRLLAKRIGGQASAPFFTRAGLIGALLFVIIHYAMMATMAEPPMWYLYDKMALEVWWMDLGKEE